VTEKFSSLNDVVWQDKPIWEFISLSDIDRKILSECWTEHKPFGPLEGEIKNDIVDHLHVEIRGTPFYDINQLFCGYRGTISDISERKNSENRAVYLALHDELTGLKNRRALNEDLPHLLNQAHGELLKVAMIGVDLDGFKAVNDSYGHEAGDNLLISVARRLEKTLMPLFQRI